MTLEYRIAELERRLSNLLRLGVIDKADYAAARVKVKSGDLVTGWIPWLTRRASEDSDWWAPEEGEQVVLLSPDGDPAQAVALPALYQGKNPPPADAKTVRRVKFADGTVIEYDRAAHEFKAEIKGRAEIKVEKTLYAEVGEAVTVKSDSDVTVTAAGDLAAIAYGDADVQAAGDLKLVASGKITITAGGNFTVDAANATVNGAGQWITSAGINSGTHTHSGVMSGGASTGPAQ